MENRLRSPFEALTHSIEAKTATIGVIGLGYVGLPLCDALHAGGLRVRGFDTDPHKIEALRDGRCYLEHFGEDRTARLSSSERFDASSDFSQLAEMDVVLVCVPTPIGKHREPDLRFVQDAARRCGRSLRRGQLFVLESTTYPGTTRNEFLQAILEGYGGREPLVPGEDFFVAYSPEREDPGRQSHSTRTIPKLVGGLDERSMRLACAVYRHAVAEVVEVSSAEVAESAKILENVFRAVNIALVNEMKVILGAMDIDVWEVVRAASTKPFGFMPFYPGPGLGGHCIPIDPFYLSWKAKEVGHPTRFIELAGEINTSMPHYVVDRAVHALNQEGRAARGSRVLVVGLTYKPDVDDTRESPSFEIIELLRALGAEVDYHDDHVPLARATRRHDLGMKSVALTAESVAQYDLVLIATDHANIDYALLARCARRILDTRDAFARRGIVASGPLDKA